MPDTENGRVTLAVLGEKLDHIEALLSAHIDDDRAWHQDHEKRIRHLETRIVTVEQKQKGIAVGQSIFTAVAATIAGFLGAQK